MVDNENTSDGGEAAQQHHCAAEDQSAPAVRGLQWSGPALAIQHKEERDRNAVPRSSSEDPKSCWIQMWSCWLKALVVSVYYLLLDF